MLPKDLAVLILSYFSFSKLKYFTKDIKLLSSICNVTEDEFTKTNLTPINRALELMALTGVRIEAAAVTLLNPLVSATLALEQRDQQLWLKLKPAITNYFTVISDINNFYVIGNNEHKWLIRLLNAMDFSQFRGLIPDDSDALFILGSIAMSDNINLFNDCLVFYTNREVGNIDVVGYSSFLTKAASMARNLTIIEILMEYNFFNKNAVLYYINDDISKLALSSTTALNQTFYADVILHKKFNLITTNLNQIHLYHFSFCLLLLGYWDRAIELLKNINIGYYLYISVDLLAFLNGKIKTPPSNWTDIYNVNKYIISLAVITIAGRLDLPLLIDKMDLDQINITPFNKTFLTFGLATAQKLQPYIVDMYFVVDIISNDYDEIYNYQTVSYFVNRTVIDSLASFTIDQVLQLDNGGHANGDDIRNYLNNFSFLLTLYQPYTDYDNFISDLSDLINSVNINNIGNFWLFRVSLANYVDEVESKDQAADFLQKYGVNKLYSF